MRTRLHASTSFLPQLVDSPTTVFADICLYYSIKYNLCNLNHKIISQSSIDRCCVWYYSPNNTTFVFYWFYSNPFFRLKTTITKFNVCRVYFIILVIFLFQASNLSPTVPTDSHELKLKLSTSNDPVNNHNLNNRQRQPVLTTSFNCVPLPWWSQPDTWHVLRLWNIRETTIIRCLCAKSPLQTIASLAATVLLVTATACSSLEGIVGQIIFCTLIIEKE